ncbi:hypothetical protein HK102_010131 [Quaeritorhiza haematococci]|nr:hypothetical protein HK102_010131 [Quaeritorhiza haematococci]
MASGFGTNGGRNRCFPFFQDFAKCYVQADHPEECRLQFEDYQECLFHTKEKLRMSMIHETYEKKQAKRTETKEGGGILASLTGSK